LITTSRGEVEAAVGAACLISSAMVSLSYSKEGDSYCTRSEKHLVMSLTFMVKEDLCSLGGIGRDAALL
jgi:hypothetical protein